MLKAENIKKKFTKITKKKECIEFYANDGISLEAHNGEIIGILGPNGAGKTTFLRIIAGILEPTSGTVTFDELNYHDNETEIKKNFRHSGSAVPSFLQPRGQKTGENRRQPDYSAGEPFGQRCLPYAFRFVAETGAAADFTRAHFGQRQAGYDFVIHCQKR